MFPRLERSSQKNRKFLPKNTLNSLFIRYMMFCVRSIRGILREEMEECTQIRANEIAILKLFQTSAGRKRSGSVELESHRLLMRRSLSSYESTSNTD